MQKAVFAVLAAFYPLALAFGPRWIAPKFLALGLLSVVLIKALLERGRGLSLLWLFGAGFLAAFSWAGNSAAPLKFYPILVSLVLLAVFGWSLFYPPTVIERFARLQNPALPEAAVAYVRRVTEVWCVFFVLNAAVSAATAIWASEEIWALYNGCLSYAAIGLVFAVEWWVRQRVLRSSARV